MNTFWNILGCVLGVILGLIVAKLAGFIACAWWVIFLPIETPVGIAIVAVVLRIFFLSGDAASGRNPFQ